MSPSPSAPRRGDTWLYLILLLAAGLRTYHLAYPAWDYHNWRQSITLMIARDFARHGFPLLHPQVAWIVKSPSAPSYFSAEFSIQSVLAAALYQVLGESDVVARLVTVSFSLLGIWCLYRLLDRRCGRDAARAGAFIYAMLPYHLFFGRVFMPDIPALALALAGLDLLDRWSDEQRPVLLLSAAGVTALAILQKLTVAFVVLPELYIFWKVYGRDLVKSRWLYAFALIAGVPAAAWYYVHGGAVAQSSVLSALTMQRLRFGRQTGLWLQARFSLPVLRALATEALSPLGLILVLYGAAAAPSGRPGRLFRLWLGGAVLLLLLIPGVVSANLYYLTLLLPGGAALAGMAVCRLPRAVRTAVLAVFFAGAIYSALPLFEPDRLPYELGTLLNSLSTPRDLLVTESGGSPNMLYYADRRGWMVGREYDAARIDRLRQSGARYYADAFAADMIAQRAFFGELDTRFQRLTAENASWQIYDLAPATGPLAVPPGDMPSARPVNFGEFIRYRGVMLRPLLGWPDSFEAVYYWQCLRTPPSNLRVFVNITDTAGRTVTQQDHWPQGGAFPTSRWTPGNLVRERYVLTLPESLQPGKYQLRLGWYDPAGGGRLPATYGSVSDNDDRVLAAEFEMTPRPAEGWFSLR